MKTKNILSAGALAIALVGGLGSCSNMLDLNPLDYYGGDDYWKTEPQVTSYMIGVHSNLRGLAWTRTITLGELRGGIYNVGGGSDGSALRNGDIISHNLTGDRPGTTTFSGYYGPIQNVNLTIDRIEALELPEAIKKYYLGELYGLRALYYFDLYRTYGGVPIQLTPDVVVGKILDPNVLRKPRAEASEVVAQIKSDIAKSEENFGTQRAFNVYPNIGGRKSTWSLAATKTLKAEVYLWNAKVTIGNQQATPADLPVAKEALLDVLNNYGLALEDNFADVFAIGNKGNKEVIMVSRFADGEAASGGVANYLYRSAQGTVRNLYRAPNVRFGDALNIKNTGILFSQYKNALYQMFDATDTRRDVTFIPAYRDAAATQLEVALVRKNIGEINAQGNRVYTSDIIHYRLPDVILMLAEVANMEGNNADVERYINMIRARAYGSDATNHTYTAGDFKTNELAILAERTKEFVQEGRRWYDLVRMQTAVSGGKSLVFDAEANIDGSTAPQLNEATEAYKTLWPVDLTLMANDPLITQTPGYTSVVRQ